MVNSIYDYIEGKQRKKYAKTHGVSSLINMFHGLPWNDDESERIYKICNDKGITWQEYYNIPPDKTYIY